MFLSKSSISDRVAYSVTRISRQIIFVSDSPFPNEEACDHSSPTSNFLLTRFLESKMQIYVRYRIASLVIVCCYYMSIVNLFLLYLYIVTFFSYIESEKGDHVHVSHVTSAVDVFKFIDWGYFPVYWVLKFNGWHI